MERYSTEPRIANSGPPLRVEATAKPSITINFDDDGRPENYRIFAMHLGEQRLLERWAVLLLKVSRALHQRGAKALL